MCFRERGLFLCSNRVTLEHPVFNTKDGRSSYEQLREKDSAIWERDDGKVMITVSIPLPEKFKNFMDREEDRYEKFTSEQLQQ